MKERGKKRKKMKERKKKKNKMASTRKSCKVSVVDMGTRDTMEER